MGWQIPICQKGRSPLKKYASRHLPKRSETFEKKYASRHLPNRNSATHSIWQKERSPLQTFKKSMPDGICRIGIRQPRFFRYHLLFGNETKLKRGVDQEVSHPVGAYCAGRYKMPLRKIWKYQWNISSCLTENPAYKDSLRKKIGM